MRGVGHAPREDWSEQRGCSEQSARDAKRESSGVPLHRTDVRRGNILARDRVDENEPRHALWSQRCEAKCDGSADVDADERRSGDTKCRQRALEVVGLGGETEVGVKGAIRLAVPEQVDSVRGVLRERERGADVAPEKAARAKAVNQNDGRAPVAVPLDVQSAGPNGDAEEIGVDGRSPESSLVVLTEDRRAESRGKLV